MACPVHWLLCVVGGLFGIIVPKAIQDLCHRLFAMKPVDTSTRPLALTGQCSAIGLLLLLVLPTGSNESKPSNPANDNPTPIVGGADSKRREARQDSVGLTGTSAVSVPAVEASPKQPRRGSSQHDTSRGDASGNSASFDTRACGGDSGNQRPRLLSQFFRSLRDLIPKMIPSQQPGRIQVAKILLLPTVKSGSAHRTTRKEIRATVLPTGRRRPLTENTRSYVR